LLEQFSFYDFSFFLGFEIGGILAEKGKKIKEVED
jgi:hypothetical protein